MSAVASKDAGEAWKLKLAVARSSIFAGGNGSLVPLTIGALPLALASLTLVYNAPPFLRSHVSRLYSPNGILLWH